MARYRVDHKEATRQRLLDSASRRFKQDGFDGAGIAALVADAGLTNGAFYGHFDSKNDLIACVVAQQLTDSATRIAALPEGQAGTDAFVAAYLSPAHRDDVACGCPSAALLDEIVRGDLATRDAYTLGLRAVVTSIARRLDPADPATATNDALALYALLVASVQMARAVTDPNLSEQILSAALVNARAMVSARASASPSTRVNH